MQQENNFEQVFRFSMNEETAVEKMKDIIEQYPYFDLAHYYLLKQNWQNKTYTNEMAAKAALHFNNLFLLNSRLNQTDEPIVPLVQEHEMDEEPSLGEDVIDTSLNIIETPPAITETTMQEHETGQPVSPAEPVIEVDTNELQKPEIAEPQAENTVQLSEPREDSKQSDLLFEPLHTTDYFASQGIKLSTMQEGNDKLGRQLKSFTGWLKTMKKLHNSYQKDTDRPIDLTVQQMAEKSNVEDEIVTEAMAEAYLQQGKSNKAREIYQKLSLLNPEKSAYFAAKLEQII